jgi:hypothetical protein
VDHDLVFDRGDGVWLNPDHVSRRFRDLSVVLRPMLGNDQLPRKSCRVVSRC